MVKFDDVFETGCVGDSLKSKAKIGSPTAKAIACSISLMGWALCLSGNKPPEKFGYGIMALAEWSGLRPIDLQLENAKATADKALSEMTA